MMLRQSCQRGFVMSWSVCPTRSLSTAYRRFLFLVSIAFLAFMRLNQHCNLLAADQPRPNIVYILADDLGYGDVQALNPLRGKIRTPHLDQLVRQGMTFTDAHSGSSVCTPTRYGLLTGRYAWRTRLQRGVLDGGNDEPLIASDRTTVASLLRQNGYATACIGKWHLGFISQPPQQPVEPADEPRDEASRTAKKKASKRSANDQSAALGATIIGGPTTRGFDFFWGCSNARTMSSLILNDKVIERIEPVAMLPRLGQQAVSYIHQRSKDARDGKPFFLYLPLTSPHTPIVPSESWQGKSGLGAYGDFVMQTDAIVGDVINALEKSGLTDNTIVVFTADNGCSPQAGTSKLKQLGHYASERFRGYKADIWDGGHRVPFLVRWPGHVKAGSQSSRLICHTDLMATCSELLGVKLSDTCGEDSVSWLSELNGERPRSVRESERAVVHHSIEGKFAIRQGAWKLCLCAGSGGWSKGGGDASPQLYDMHVDPGETNNLAAAQPEVVQQLIRLLESYVANGRSTPGPQQHNDVKVRIMGGSL